LHARWDCSIKQDRGSVRKTFSQENIVCIAGREHMSKRSSRRQIVLDLLAPYSYTWMKRGID